MAISNIEISYVNRIFLESINRITVLIFLGKENTLEAVARRCSVKKKKGVLENFAKCKKRL